MKMGPLEGMKRVLIWLWLAIYALASPIEPLTRVQVASANDEAALQVTVKQPFFKQFRPLVNNILKDNIHTIRFENLTIFNLYFPMLGHYAFNVGAFHITNLTDIRNTSIQIDDGAIAFDMENFKVNVEAEYVILQGEKRYCQFKGPMLAEAIVNVHTFVNMTKSFNSDIELTTENTDLNVVSFQVKVPGKVVNWLVGLVQKLFGGMLRNYVSNYVQKIMKRDLLPIVADMFNSYAALGVHRHFKIGNEQVVTRVLENPKITSQNGIEIPLAITHIDAS